MFPIIRADSPVPIFEQIERYWVFRIATGHPQPGEFLPSVRKLAQKLLIHPNTVVNAYEQLEGAGIITARRGVGMEVTMEAPGICKKRREEMVKLRLQEILAESTQGGMSPTEILRLLRVEIKTREDNKA
ncbi:MAG: GntR family transcriptional regulator [Gemmataceae bacterium]|nr:GntR family transcriptional regulator [Gemmataceae bacterium]